MQKCFGKASLTVECEIRKKARETVRDKGGKGEAWPGKEDRM
jgi:hypothetical protein